MKKFIKKVLFSLLLFSSFAHISANSDITFLISNPENVSSVYKKIIKKETINELPKWKFVGKAIQKGTKKIPTKITCPEAIANKFFSFIDFYTLHKNENELLKEFLKEPLSNESEIVDFLRLCIAVKARMVYDLIAEVLSEINSPIITNETIEKLKSKSLRKRIKKKIKQKKNPHLSFKSFAKDNDLKDFIKKYNKQNQLIPLTKSCFTKKGNLRLGQYSLDLSNQKLLNLKGLEKQLKKELGETAPSYITSLNVGFNYIQDITEAQKFTKLKSLYIENNNISDLSPIQNLKKLSVLFASSNDIESIDDLTPLYNSLNVLDLIGNNKIPGIDIIFAFNNLSSLSVPDNEEINLNVLAEAPALKFLTITFSQIEQVRPLLEKESLSLTELYILTTEEESKNLSETIGKLKKTTQPKKDMLLGETQMYYTVFGSEKQEEAYK